MGLHQSMFAADPELRADLSTIASDELGHAHLALRIDAFARKRLGMHAMLDAAREHALDELSSAPSPAPNAARALGLPDHDTLLRLREGAGQLARRASLG